VRVEAFEASGRLQTAIDCGRRARAVFAAARKRLENLAV